MDAIGSVRASDNEHAAIRQPDGIVLVACGHQHASTLKSTG
jgi:hypothetical protein